MTYYVDVTENGSVVARDVYVHTADEAAFLAKAEASGLTDKAGIAIDAGIPVVDTPATYDADGNVLTPATFETGYFVNVRLFGPSLGFTDWIDEWAADGVVTTPPATPSRVWL
jgi:hypothetical protein